MLGGNGAAVHSFNKYQASFQSDWPGGVYQSTLEDAYVTLALRVGRGEVPQGEMSEIKQAQVATK